MTQKKIKAGITQGDINGIGYEIIMKTLNDARVMDTITPVVYGSQKVAAYHRKALNMNSFMFSNIHDARDAAPKRVNLINCTDDSVRVELGKATADAGKASFNALKEAVADLKENKIDVLVTSPFNKYYLQSLQFSFPGHTEFLQAEFESEEVLMMMVGEYFKVGVVTGHIALKDVVEEISVEKVNSKIVLFDKSLREDFNIRKPKLAVLGLNPHAGEEGILGIEEKEIITPAIELSRNAGIIVSGPFPADGFFYSGMFSKFDGVLAMYHDQGLIPFKTLHPGEGVNYTAGLPVVRTSPAHGTGYDIAGKDEASPNSFRKALFLAYDIFNNRYSYAEAHKNVVKQHDLRNI